MSQFLNFAGNQGTTFKNHGTGGGTSFTLDLQATTNSVLLAVGGVLQEPSVDYTVSGTTITTTTSVTAGIEVFSWILHKPGTAPVIQDNSVTGGKIALTSQAEGDIMYCNASGDWVRLAKGTAGQVLTQNSGLTAPEWATSSATGWEFVSQTVLSSDASYTLSGLTTGYDYQLTLQNVRPATDTVDLQMQVGVSGPTYRTSGYKQMYAEIASSTGASGAAASTTHFNIGRTQGNATDEHANLLVTIFDPAASGTDTSAVWHGITQSGSSVMFSQNGGGHYQTSESNTDFRIQYSSGNLASGTITLHRRANA